MEEWQCANNKVFLCHQGELICVNQNAVQAHLAHGDFLGPCQAVFCDEIGYQGHHVLNYTPDLHDDHQHPSFAETDDPNEDAASNDEIMIENFPNPFFPETVIRFYLPHRQYASLSVFDYLGKPVISLAEGVYDKGWYEFSFDGSDYAEGMYFYSIRTKDQVHMKSMVLVRK